MSVFDKEFNLKKPQLKKLTTLIALAGLGVASIFVAGIFDQNSANAPVPPTNDVSVTNNGSEETSSSINQEEKQLENQIKSLLGQIDGVGQVAVKVRLKGTALTKVAMNESVNKKNIEEAATDGGTRKTAETTENNQVVMVNGKVSGEAPVVVETVRPDIQGVVVVAEGAVDETVRVMLTRTVQTLLELPANKVTVLPKGGN